ncbi:SulP family sulfate permease [Luteibacter sp. OK325]|uniref:SulP family inorganic anion transporter n=1 Tax=Luteibacter sp. OK325 TaxID=2135670 RepID=UPI000D375F3B|nr:SulP family inorganic anion transporter [Luteibacter sp. OK325]PTR34096.1 SulP family sulfate permease [Luteibacter sp. OK325]
MSRSTLSVRQNLLAGLTTAFALVPEAMAFALVAHLNPLMGLYGAAIIAALTAAFGGRPGMISGAAGSMAVVIVALVVQHGSEYFLLTVLLGGLIQCLFGLLRLGKLVRMIPHPVMLGFVNGLAIVIAGSQLEHLHAPGGGWLSGNALYLMLGLALVAMLVVYLLPRLTRVVPSALASIVIVSLIVHLFGLPTRAVGDIASIKGGLPLLHWPQVPWTLDTLKIVFPYALVMAMVGLLETLLTLNLVDEITATEGQPNRECIALGAANVVSGLFGGMGGCAMIGQTMINLTSGGRTRLSGITAGVLVMCFVLFLSPLIERIPLAALFGVMLVVAQKTFAWGSVPLLRRLPLSDALTIVAVTVITVLANLATAVLCGVLISAIAFAWKHADRLSVNREELPDGGRLYRLRGTLYFAATSRLMAMFDVENDPAYVELDCSGAHLDDHSAVEAIETLRRRYAQQGKQLHVTRLNDACEALLMRVGGTEASASRH